MSVQWADYTVTHIQFGEFKIKFKNSAQDIIHNYAGTLYIAHFISIIITCISYSSNKLCIFCWVVRHNKELHNRDKTIYQHTDIMQ